MAEETLIGKQYGELLVSLGIITLDDLNRALSIQSNKGGDLDAVLVENEIVSWDRIADCLSEHLSVDTVDLSETPIGEEVLNSIPVRLVHRYQMVPVEKEDGHIKVATADPSDFAAIDDIKFVSKCDVEPLLAYSEDIKTAIKRYYGIGSDTMDGLIDQDGVDLEAEVASGNEGDIEELSEDASIIRFVNQVMSEAISDRATDIHIEPFEHLLRIRYRIDGLLYEASLPPAVRRYQAAIISRIKIMADMNIAEKRLPHDGRITIRRGGTEFDLRVSTVPTH